MNYVYINAFTPQELHMQGMNLGLEELAARTCEKELLIIGCAGCTDVVTHHHSARS